MPEVFVESFFNIRLTGELAMRPIDIAASFRESIFESADSRLRTGRARVPSTPGDNPRLLSACREFESLFIHHLLTELRATVDRSGLFGDGRVEEMFTSMLDGELARELATGRGIGLAAVLYRQLASKAEVSAEHDPNPLQEKAVNAVAAAPEGFAAKDFRSPADNAYGSDYKPTALLETDLSISGAQQSGTVLRNDPGRNR
jgi:flagellar protein FlgJ